MPIWVCARRGEHSGLSRGVTGRSIMNASYATNASTLYVIADIVKKNPSRIKTIDQFHADARSGSLPSVTYVDPNILTGTE